MPPVTRGRRAPAGQQRHQSSFRYLAVGPRPPLWGGTAVFRGEQGADGDTPISTLRRADTFMPESAKCGYACHTIIQAKDWPFKPASGLEPLDDRHGLLEADGRQPIALLSVAEDVLLPQHVDKPVSYGL